MVAGGMSVDIIRGIAVLFTIYRIVDAPYPPVTRNVSGIGSEVPTFVASLLMEFAKLLVH